ncbi:MAG: hypothetical protein KHZ27_10115 [Fusobacterium sp.]|nr:hypothetical protein [Fusobacterium sp.]
MEFCIRILKIIYGAVEIEQEYESNEVFNIKIEEEINNDLVLHTTELECHLRRTKSAIFITQIMI